MRRLCIWWNPLACRRSRAPRSCTANRGDPMISFTGRKRPAQCEPMPRQRIEPACPAKTISKVNPTWAASMAARPACPSRRRVRTTASATRTSWQSATPVKPIGRRRRPNQNSAQGVAPQRRLVRVLDLLEHRLVAHHQRHLGRHHRQPSRCGVRRGAGCQTIDVSVPTWRCKRPDLAEFVAAQVMLPGMKQRIRGRPLT